MTDIKRREILRVIAGRIAPLNDTYEVQPEKVWSIWIMPARGGKGLWITNGAPQDSDLNDGYMLTVTRKKGWRFWQKAASVTFNYRISQDEFLRELREMAQELHD